MHPDAEPVAPLGEGSRLADPGEYLELGDRLVWTLPDGLDVDSEEAVAHCRVPDDDRLVDHATVDAQLTAKRLDFAIQGARHRPPQFPRGLTVVRDAVHHVAATEALRVLERADPENRTGLEVDQLDHDRRCPDVDGQTEGSPTVDIEGFAVICHHAFVPRHRRIK